MSGWYAASARCKRPVTRFSVGHPQGTPQDHDYYARQLQDMKMSLNLSRLTSTTLVEFAALCGRALARAHSRNGDAAAIDGYLGERSDFEKAVAQGAVEYAEITRIDHAQLVDAIKSGELPHAGDATP